MEIEIDGMTPPMILPPQEKGYRYLLPGEVIPEGSEMFDWKGRRFYPVEKCVGNVMPVDPLHNSLVWIPVRVRILA